MTGRDGRWEAAIVGGSTGAELARERREKEEGDSLVGGLVGGGGDGRGDVGVEESEEEVGELWADGAGFGS